MQLTQYIIPLVISFAITVCAMPLFISYFKQKKYGQQTLEEVKQHEAKAGTPTMGGFVFLIAIVISVVITGLWFNELTPQVLILLFILVLYGLLGFLDDFIKIFLKRNMGLTSWQKLVGQIIGGIIFFLVYQSEGLPDTINIFGIWELPIGLFYGVFIVIWLVGFSNAVNLTDGLDGLVSILATISFIAYGIIAWKQQQYDVLVMIVATIGGLLGFFGYNHKPAKIFMGDVGSLALGGILAAISSLLHQEWTLLLIGFVYVIETLSVMLQVTYFKLTGGKRIFAMTPIHHHFELGGITGKGKRWSEWKVDIVFWIVGAIASIIALIIVL
ncbi:MAG: phospho-N-acetylmuramoyl-pentapeptide-transferase [Lactobacillales bacterium]|nr:phospho-N-acetylmuramoyl-pentapeptide-transferase [Lactobacillales bacterium]